ncbi:hypothetical protein CWN53_27915 [Klebsiella pneumoniae]|uniref:hypothetical protein n=1 Tax=Klebsiella pneumoniae TaxID=573 RepID=UPI000C7D7515|nr:hypothetical protein [Klebsiella pneumoniae]PLK34548.1 hypothetical protein CWN74_27040 [Klebsiella pneumoniae]PLK84236.1 hypothetical protein CWN67_30635 [Klebsiella pneumoniae]PLM07847.1 hypothetical protein CWN51_23195 [Klebsiella pneumoniae]PLN60996.1 hypothetical protein CWN53_27915 [Klebsiella pneumoniae]PLO26508.1 hypothetical protein CWN38_18170 [Klebsiella pneumoniae]
MNIETVNELIRSLESAGELSIREQKFLKLAKAHVQLAAENVALKNLARGWANATDDRLFEEFGEISHDSIDDCEAELKIICPATDRIVAGIKADGVEEFASYISLYNSNAERHAIDFAKQLREGVNHD